MRISRFLLFIILLYGQEKIIRIQSLEFKLVNESLEKRIKKESDLSIIYKLDSFSENPSSTNYIISRSYKLIDSLLIKDNIPINKKVLKQILFKYKNKPINSDFKLLGESLVSRYLFINKVPKYKIGLIGPHKTALILDLKPNFINHFSGFFGINKKKEKINLNGEIMIHLENYFKEAELLNFHWKKIGSYSQLIKINIGIPHPIGWNIGINWYYNFEIINGLYTTSDVEYSFKTFLPIIHNLDLGYVYGSTTPTLKGQNRNYQKNTFQAFSLKTKKDSRNKRFFPTRGLLLKNQINAGLQNKSTFIEIKNKMSFYHLFNNKIIFNTKYIVEGIFDPKNKIPKSRLNFFGGTSTLRGFNENQFSSTQFQIITLETGYNISSFFQTKLFLNIASKEINFFASNLTGYGFGIYQIKNNSLIQIEYALSNLSPMDGKLHFKWISSF